MTTYLNNAQKAEFEVLARPLMKWLCENTDPHCSITVEPTRATLSSGHDYSTGEITDYLKG